MFLIQNDTHIHWFDQDVITIGNSPDSDLVLNVAGAGVHHAQFFADFGRRWNLRILGNERVQVGQREIYGPQSVQVRFTDVIMIANQSLVIRDVIEQSEVGETLDQENFDLQRGIHGKVLDTIRERTSGLTGQQLEKRIVNEMEAALAKVKLNPEFEVHLALKALKKLLQDRVQSYKKEAKAPFYPDSAPPEVQHAQLIKQLEGVLQLGKASSMEEKTERVEALTSWALQKIDFAPATKRRLALGLIKEQLLDIIFGFGPLEDLMNIGGINDIMVLPSGKIFIDSKGRIQDTGRRMLTPEVSMSIVQRIVSKAGRRIDKGSPMVDARVSDGSRLNAIIEPVSISGPALTIRRFTSKPFSIEELIASSTLTDTVANFLQACVLARKNLIISGGTGSGKTTLLNALASYVPDVERIITIEDTAEIQLGQSHVVALQSRPANLEGKNAIPIRRLVKNALRMRPDRIIVGECRGGEAFDMLQAMNTGHDGSLTTVHANSTSDALRRVEVMALEAEDIDLPSRAIREQISSAVDLIVQVTRFPKGARRVVSVSEVVEFDEDDGSIIVEEVYRYRWSKKKRGMSQRKLAFTGYVPTFVDELVNTGIVSVGSMF